MKKRYYTNSFKAILLLLTLLSLLNPIYAKAANISLDKVLLPKLQVKAFPITKSFLFAMTETLSNQRKYLVVVTASHQHKKKANGVASFLKKSNIDFDTFSKHVYSEANGHKNERVLFYIDAKTKKEALYVADHVASKFNMSVAVGKNLINYSINDRYAHSFFKNMTKEQLFNDDVQDAYLIQRVQNSAYTVLKSKYFLETVVETYLEDIYKRSRTDIVAFQKEVENEETGEIEYLPNFSVEYGNICQCDYSEVNPKARYKDNSFYKAFQENHLKRFGKHFTIELAKKETSFLPLLITENKEFVKYFNDAFLSSAYSDQELKFTTNSKGVTIFCVNGKDGYKMCKTKKEILEHINLQNKIMH